MSDFLVSVVMITYKHEHFISEAIEGVLNQNFDLGSIELLIADDCSPDKTNEVIVQYPKSKNGITINYIRHTTNRGIIDNFFGALAHAKGKYVAICEGDDYWTDPLKLQKQIEFLQKNKGVAITSHNVQIVGQEFKESIDRPYHEDAKTGYRRTVDLIKGFKLPTNSIVFRNGFYDFDKVPEWSKSIRSGDKFLYLVISQFGAIYYDEEVMAAYRKHPEGAVGSYEYWNLDKHIEIHQNQIYFWKNFKTFFYPLYQNEIKKNIATEASQIVYRCTKENKYPKISRRFAFVTLKNDPQVFQVMLRDMSPVFKKHIKLRIDNNKIRLLILGSKVKQTILRLLNLKENESH